MCVQFAGLSQPEAFSVCVVGAGPVGIAAAVELSSLGIRTVLLEAGGARARPQSAAEASLVDTAGRPQHRPDTETVARGLGGTSSRWGGRCVELDDIDFEARAFASADGWPIAHAELAPHYARARRLLSSDIPADERPAGGTAPFDRSVEVWTRECNTARVNQHHLRSCPALEVVVNCEVVAINFCGITERVRSLAVVADHQRREIAADVFILAAGGRGCARLLLDLQAEHAALFGGPAGPLGRYYMGHVAGEIAEVAFADAAEAQRYALQRLSNGTAVRRRFQPSVELQRSLGLLNVALWPNSCDDSRLVRGDGARSVRYLAGLIAGRGRVRETLNSGSVHDHVRNVLAHPLRAIAGTSRGAAERCRRVANPAQRMRLDPTNTYLLRYHSEQIPNAESRVSLTSCRDRLGRRKLDTSFHFKPQDYASVVAVHEALDRCLRRTGIGRLDYLVGPDQREAFVAAQAADGFHQIGLTRMGYHRRDGVVDGNGRVFDVGNLYVAGSSVFRSSGQANPTLPAVAFAVRLAHHVRAALSRVRADPVGAC